MPQEPNNCDLRNANSREKGKNSVKQKVDFVELSSYAAKYSAHLNIPLRGNEGCSHQRTHNVLVDARISELYN